MQLLATVALVDFMLFEKADTHTHIHTHIHTHTHIHDLRLKATL
jgi:hypothetical protein